MKHFVKKGIIYGFIVEQHLKHVLAFVCHTTALTTHGCLNLGSRLGGGDKIKPFRLWIDRLGGENLYLITTAQLLT